MKLDDHSSKTPWRWISAIIFLVGSVIWIGSAISPTIKRQAAASELRRGGFEVGSGSSALEECWNAVKATFVNRAIPQQNAYTERVALTSNSVESLVPFEPSLTRFQPKWISLNACSKLEDVGTLKLLPELVQLEIRECPGLTDLSIISELGNLRLLYLSKMAAVKAVPRLRSGGKLTILLLIDCAELSEFDRLQDFTSLAVLSISGSPMLQNTDPLRGLKQLETLVLSKCTRLSDVSALHSLTKLKFVRLNGCQNLPPEAVAALRAALPRTQIEYP